MKEHTEEPFGGGNTRGRWVKRAPREGDGGVAALTWEDSPPLRKRLLRGLSLPAVAAVTVFVIALVITAVVLLRSLSGDRDAESLHARVAAGAAGHDENSGHSGTGPGGESDDAGRVFVHLVGAVERPGVVELSAGARVLDAIEAAGGATAAAELGAVNLAREVSDGEQIVVFDAEMLAEAATAAAGGQASMSEHGGGGALGEAYSGGPGAPGTTGLVNVNTATAEELQQLNGVGPALAQRIIAWREEHGRFDSIEQLQDVSGIGAKKFEGFRDQVAV